MNDPEGQVTRQEEAIDHWRRRAGLALAPIVFLVLWWVPLAGLAENAHRLLAVFGLVVTLWLTEAIPLAVTALLGPTLCVVCGIASDKEMFKNFGHPIIFLFLGSFLLAEAMLHHGLNRRIAFAILSLRWVGQSPARILWAFAGISGFLSMWISNTTAAAMMLPIGVAILSEMARRQSEREGREVRFTDLKYGTGLMLATAFAASIGGMATPVGTPPNLIAVGFIEKSQGLRITFFQWMAFGVPLAVVMLAFLGFYLNRACPAEPGLLDGSAAWIQAERAKLGPLSRGERNVLIAFSVTVILWLLPGVVAVGAGVNAPLFKALERHSPEAAASLLGATLLFVLPVNLRRGEFTIGWTQARGIDWGTILLFGGGLALGDAMFSTGLARWIGEGLAHSLNAHTALGLTVLFTVIAVLLTETTSNTATANMVVPVAIAVAQAAQVNPVPPALAACLGASLAFMLPVSTPPNAIVFGTGCVPLLKMVKHGIVLDLFGMAAIIVVVHWWLPRFIG
ncbi:MAG: DASS family sodium-coupled anion symporter [Verrucomicrobia bacterium]|nr:DASS family sodium-coupled anion symporter [Verrucomicrobiota bacterium]